MCEHVGPRPIRRRLSGAARTVRPCKIPWSAPDATWQRQRSETQFGVERIAAGRPTQEAPHQLAGLDGRAGLQHFAAESIGLRPPGPGRNPKPRSNAPRAGPDRRSPAGLFPAALHRRPSAAPGRDRATWPSAYRAAARPSFRSRAIARRRAAAPAPSRVGGRWHGHRGGHERARSAPRGRVAPALDVVGTTYFVVNSIFILSRPDCGSAGFGESCIDGGVKAGATLLSTALAATFVASAVSGFKSAARCENPNTMF